MRVNLVVMVRCDISYSLRCENFKRGIIQRITTTTTTKEEAHSNLFFIHSTHSQLFFFESTQFSDIILHSFWQEKIDWNVLVVVVVVASWNKSYNCWLTTFWRANPSLFLFIFSLFNQIIQILQQFNMKIVHLVPGFELTTSWLRVSSLNHWTGPWLPPKM